MFRHRFHILARKTHRWLGLFIGLQVVMWSLSGLYMTVVHIDTIHGDHLVQHQQPKLADAQSLVDPLVVVAAHDASSVRLAWLRDRPIYAGRSEAG